MATNTYVELASNTIANNTTTYVDFTSIPQTYTDLVIVCNVTSYGGGGDYIHGQFGNGSIDTTSNYSTTVFTGNGSTPATVRWQNRTNFNMDYYSTPTTTEPSTRILQIMNYSNSTTYKTALLKAGRAGNGVDVAVGMWRNTAAVNTLRISTNANYFASGTIFSLYGIKSEPVYTAKATGGNIVFGGDGYTYHAFTSSGTFTPSTSLSCDVLAIAGGGGAGANHGGGGGAGGLLYTSASSFSATGYTVTVGSGGTGGSSGADATQGQNSSVNSLVAIGGGRGGDYTRNYAAGNGGSGGGENSNTASGIGLGTSGQGNNGGAKNPNYGLTGGGGGGAGAVGETATAPEPPDGGIGSSSYDSWGRITASGQLVNGVRYYAGGGGGGGWNGSMSSGLQGYGGYGGGGNSGPVTSGGVSNGDSGVANTGGGGGCGGGGSSTGGAGGSGIVIIRYASA